MIVFIAGPRKVSRLNRAVEERLNNIYLKQYDVVLGDANGIDKAVQIYFHKKGYSNVTIYSTGSVPRNNIGNWEVCAVEVKTKTKDFDYFAAKDIKMAEKADYGLMIWNGTSKGTLHNTLNLLVEGKQVAFYLIPESKFYTLTHINDLEQLIVRCNDETKYMYKELLVKVKKSKIGQIEFNIE